MGGLTFSDEDSAASSFVGEAVGVLAALVFAGWLKLVVRCAAAFVEAA